MSQTHSVKFTFKASFINAGIPGKAALILASWFGAGLMPIASGTFGTLGAVPLVLISSALRPNFAVLFLLAFTLLAIWISGLSREILGRDDPSEIVIDEVAGFLLTLLFIPITWFSLFIGFVLFRIFDILKPFPIRRLERIKGGAGIVLDDILAGIYANLSLRIVLSLIQLSGTS